MKPIKAWSKLISLLLLTAIVLSSATSALALPVSTNPPSLRVADLAHRRPGPTFARLLAERALQGPRSWALWPAPGAFNSLSGNAFLPMVVKSPPFSFVVISTDGGSISTPEGNATLTFGPGGIPEPIHVGLASSSAEPSGLPLNLYPLSTPFIAQASWTSDNTPVAALDREARPIHDPDAGKAIPPEYHYWATVSVHLSEEELRLVDDEWLAVARLDAVTGKWILLPTQLDRQSATATASTERLGTFLLVQNMPNGPVLVGDGTVALPSGNVLQSEVIVDDLDPNFRHEQDPRVPEGPYWWDGSCGGGGCYAYHSYWTWNRSTYEDRWLLPGEPCNWATWQPALSAPGYYVVAVFVPGSEADTQGADYVIYHNGAVDTVRVNQAANSGAFVNLGAFQFSADGSEYLYMNDVVAETPRELGSHVGYDAAFFVPGDDGGNLPPSPEEIARLFALGVRRWQKSVGDPVSTSTGNHVQQIEVVSIPGRDGLDLEMVITYNALSDYTGHFGLGQSSILDVRAMQYSDGSVMVWLADGQAWYWLADGDSYTGWEGVQGQLEKVENGWKLTLPDQTAYTFQQSGWEGRLMYVEDRHGNSLHLLYNGDGQVTALTDDAGRSLIFTYEGNLVSQIQDPLRRTWGFRYSDDRLSEYQDARGGVTRYTYTNGYLDTLVDPEGITYLQNSYDGRGRVIEQIDANGHHSYWAYDDNAHATTFTDNKGRQSTYRYDDKFRLVEEGDNLGQTATYEFDGDYNLIAWVDKMGRRWEYSYDERGNLLSERGPLVWSRSYTYNEANDLTSVTDALEHRTTYTWQAGNLVRTRLADGADWLYSYDRYGQRLAATNPNGHTTQFSYDQYGNMVMARSPLGCATWYSYDLAGRMTGMTDGNDHTVGLEYDANDNVTGIVDPRQNRSTMAYDGNDNLVQMVDRRGGIWTYRYDANLKPMAATDPGGHTTNYAYDETYNRTSITDPLMHTTWMRYDGLDRLEEVEDPAGGLTHYEYDANDNLVKIVDALTQATNIRYDELNRLVAITDPLNGESRFEYDLDGHLTQQVNPRGAATRYQYNEVEQLTLVVDALEGKTAYGYDDAGNPISITDANGHKTIQRYDDDERLVEEEDPAGHRTGYGYDCVGNLVRLVDGNGSPTEFRYDANDNRVLIVDALTGQTLYTYDEEDNQTSATDPNGNTSFFTYDLDGLLVQVTEAGGQVTRFEHDAGHNIARLVNAKGNATGFEYDTLDRLIALTDPLLYTTRYSYDPLSRLTAVTDANNVVTRYEYDPIDRLTAVVQNERPGEPSDYQTNVRTGYEYDAAGNLLGIVDANGQATRFEYDLLDRLIRETDPIGSTWRYEYDPVGNLNRRIDANGAITDYAYAADGLLVNIHYPDNAKMTFSYDAAHNQLEMADRLGLTVNTYDALNRLASTTNHLGQAVRYAYDPAGNRTALTYPDGRVVQYEYDVNNRISRVIDPDGNIFTAEYDPTHNVTAIRYPNQTQARMAYDADDRLIGVINEEIDGRPISTFAYTLDPLGNRTHSEEYYGWRQPETMSHDFRYDPLYRLLNSGDSEGRFTTYAYDAVGNRTRLESNYDPLRTPTDVDPYRVEYSYNAANQLLTTNHSVFGATEYSYDANGNRIRRQGPDVWIGNPHDQLRTDYTYDYENQLTWAGNSFDSGNGNWQVRDETSMLYDGYGRVFRRTHDQHQGSGGLKWTEFVYDGLDPIAEYVEPNPQYTNYYRGLGRILELHDFKSQQSPAGTAYYYHYDGLGSVSAITKHRGQSAHTYRYWDYGIVLDVNDGASDSSDFTGPHNHYTLTGQEWEEGTRLYHFYAREYDPVVGVWLQKDPYRGQMAQPETLQRYGYVGENPVNVVDLYGYGWREAFVGTLVGTLAGAVGGGAVGGLPGAIAGAIIGGTAGGVLGYRQDWFREYPHNPSTPPSNPAPSPKASALADETREQVTNKEQQPCRKWMSPFGKVGYQKGYGYTPNHRAIDLVSQIDPQDAQCSYQSGCSVKTDPDLRNYRDIEERQVVAVKEGQVVWVTKVNDTNRAVENRGILAFEYTDDAGIMHQLRYTHVNTTGATGKVKAGTVLGYYGPYGAWGGNVFHLHLSTYTSADKGITWVPADPNDYLPE